MISLYRFQFMAGITAAIALSGCGGGGGGGGNQPPAPQPVSVLTGQFSDSEVSGLRYLTSSRSGTTDAAGRFEYVAGETVEFYLGDLLLGAAQGAATLTPFDLVPEAEPFTGSRLRYVLARADGLPNQYPIAQVLNIAIVLQTLDSDNDPDNGIEIVPEMAALFSADSVAFDRGWSRLRTDPGFRAALSQAKVDGLLDPDRRVRQPWRALQHLYAGLGIDHGVRGLVREETDSNADGAIDLLVSQEFDGDGNLILRAVDGDLDGVPDSELVFEYDSDGDRTSSTLVARTIRDERTTYTRDADGNEIGSRTDFDNDGTVDTTTDTEYDASGNPLRSLYDDDGDGTADAIVTYQYDSAGNEILREEDNDGDGITDRIVTQEFDPSGRLIRSVLDENPLIAAAAVTTFEYNTVGNLIRTVYDFEGDGIADQITGYEYDSAANITTFIIDSDADNNANRVVRFTYNQDGLRTGTLSEDSSGAALSIQTTEYDADNNETSATRDNNGDGTIDYIRTSESDATGNMTLQAFDTDADGIIDFQTTMSYGNSDDLRSLFDPPPI